MKYVFRVDDFSYYSSLKHCPEQRHSSVYGKLEAEHLQLPAHRFLHLHLISSRHPFDASDSTVQNGCHATISIFAHPILQAMVSRGLQFGTVPRYDQYYST